ncbi:hypothetical protein AB395_00001563 [Sinorhizobium fredii CCBAU 45436]|nr:hypothetical protein SF83666_c15210 [Sinorhizobium fredii CCBAU 83666]AWI57219.1 hypothetical protein AB395_00001563 [Sinorhizobium fredii CCBAU 45436]AWM25019.1 hypothetical protein AOX55_00001765 [Sinorhizobium fredii CCBAU 25509]
MGHEQPPVFPAPIASPDRANNMRGAGVSYLAAPTRRA